jgi:hypothetical protein
MKSSGLPSSVSTTLPSSSTSVWKPRLCSARRAGRPMNEYRPKRSPPTTDSSRKLFGAAASFRYSDRGVSRSAKVSSVSGMRV